MTLLGIAVAATGCGGSGGGGDDGGADGPGGSTTITVTGTAVVQSATGSNPADGVLIEAFASSDDATVVASTMTDAQGNYTLVVMPNGAALDGYLKATKSGLMVTYLYPPEPLTADFDGASVNMLSQNTFNLLASTFCKAAQDAAKGTIAVLVEDATNTEVAGATIASDPAASNTCYNGNTGLPSQSATATAADGLGYLFNVTGQATVSAMKTGSTFQSHGVVARAGALTTTLVH